MYGTVSRWRILDGKQEEFEQLLQEVLRDRPPGSRSVLVFRADHDHNEYWTVGVFESRDAYNANSATPEQTERYNRLRALMHADPEWHDGEVVASF